MLIRKYRDKVVLPYINFTNTQLNSANSQYIYLSRVNTQFDKKNLSVSLEVSLTRKYNNFYIRSLCDTLYLFC